MTVATHPTSVMPQQVASPKVRRDWGQDTLASTLMIALIVFALLNEWPQVEVLVWVAAIGLLACRWARLWGFAAIVLMLGTFVSLDLQWLRADLLGRGGWLMGVVNLWLFVAMKPPAGPAAPQKEMMQELAQVREELVKERQAVNARDEQVAELQQQHTSSAELVQMLQSKLQVMEEHLHRVEPLATEAEELRGVLQRALDRQAEYEARLSQLQEIVREHEHLQAHHQVQSEELERNRTQLSEALDHLLRQQQEQADLYARVTAAAQLEIEAQRVREEFMTLQQECAEWRTRCLEGEQRIEELLQQIEEALAWAAEREQLVHRCADLEEDVHILEGVAQEQKEHFEREQTGRQIELQLALQRVEELTVLLKGQDELTCALQQAQEALQENQARCAASDEQLRQETERVAELDHQLQQQAIRMEELQMQLEDPQRQEAVKRVTIMERTLALKEQVMARLTAQLEKQQHEWAELLRTKHLHQQLREQFEQQRVKLEERKLACETLEMELYALQEQVYSLDPSEEVMALLHHITAMEKEHAEESFQVE